ncbi:hypothetical protein GPECTOR_610g693 [Gonium pectorale]|uniref:Uncharacterized protein n=1 Tax=Gonium pectorale TaxID=33097 RepID=A0A150FVL5_GONPE|nr:hypothetical protein GPECTOR_610g693 [Gonium pectorale]|eukprot:KXZ41245.1 hypothetical protein GPECTOR_610g693 [Gonium pectorale]
MSAERISGLAAEAILPVLEAAGQQLEYLGIRSLNPMAPPGTGGLPGLRALRQRSKRAELRELFAMHAFQTELDVRQVVEIMGQPQRFGLASPMAGANQILRAPAAPEQQQQPPEQAAGTLPVHPVTGAAAGPQGQGLTRATALRAVRWAVERMFAGASGRGGYDIGAWVLAPAAVLAQSPPELERWVYHGEGHELYSSGGLFSWESLRAVQPLPSLGAVLVACDLAGRPAEAEAGVWLPRGDGGAASSAGVQVVPLPRGCVREELFDRPVLLSLEIQKQIMCGVLEVRGDSGPLKASPFCGS